MENSRLFSQLQLPLSLGLACLLNARRVWFRDAPRLAFFSSYLVGQVFLAVLAHVLLEPRRGFARPLERLWSGWERERLWLLRQRRGGVPRPALYGAAGSRCGGAGRWCAQRRAAPHAGSHEPPGDGGEPAAAVPAGRSWFVIENQSGETAHMRLEVYAGD